MAEYLIQDTTLDAIANAIHDKSGASVPMTPAEMVTAIGNISGGGGEEVPDISDIVVPLGSVNNAALLVVDKTLLYGDTINLVLGSPVHNRASASCGHIENGTYVVDINFVGIDAINTSTFECDLSTVNSRYAIINCNFTFTSNGAYALQFSPLKAVLAINVRCSGSMSINSPGFGFRYAPNVSFFKVSSASFTMGSLSERQFPLASKTIIVESPAWSEAPRTMREAFSGFVVLESISLPTVGVKLTAANQSNSILNAYRGCLALKQLDLSMIDVSEVTIVTDLFSACVSLETLNLDGWNMSAVTTGASTMFSGTQVLQNISLHDSVLPSSNISFSSSSMLSNASLIEIANALPVASYTLTLHATPKAALQTIVGTVSDGVFTEDASGTVTLMDFITNTKGWTVA